MSYITVEDIETRLGQTFTAEESAMLTDLVIPAIENLINNYTGRVFGVAGNPDEDRYFLGVRRYNFDYDPLYGDHNAASRTFELDIDDIVSITAIAEVNSAGDESALTLTNYEQLPLNKEYTNRLFSKADAFTGYKYKVTGRWGTSDTVPEEIQLAALLMVESWITQQGGIKKESIEGYSYELGQIMLENNTIANILFSWKIISV